MAKRKSKDPLAWGIILIVIGLIFLLNNIDINVWGTIARLWPLILIVWGAWKLYFGIKEKQEEERLE
ncbi:MAG: DUF5668 domain-containing protein [Candidatus Aminicenantaceae bacterium]|jgi:putative Mn2+ efflux pump MntP